MDSLSQLALGASLGIAVLGRRTAVWKAALWGGIAGTLPDLDVLINHGDPLSNMVGHRGASHALFYLTLFSPALAWLAWRIHARAVPFARWWLALWLALITHPLLDACTVYGTRLLLPFTDHAFGTGSIFIIDPLYTLPLCIGVAMAWRRASPGGLRANTLGLVLSSAYLLWSLAAQAHVQTLALQSLPPGFSAQGGRILVTPAPLNTALWRIVAQDAQHDYEGFHSFFDPSGPIRFQLHPRGQALAATLPADNPAFRLAAFAQGFVRYSEHAGVLRITDLRMGQEPHYAFAFDVAERDAKGQWRAQPPRAAGTRAEIGPSLRWLARRIAGYDDPAP